MVAAGDEIKEKMTAALGPRQCPLRAAAKCPAARVNHLAKPANTPAESVTTRIVQG